MHKLISSPQFSSLKSHTRIISQCPWGKNPGMAQLSLLHGLLQSCSQVLATATVSSKGLTGEVFTSKVTQLLAEFGSLKFSLGASAPSRLLARGHPQFLARWACPTWQLVSSNMQAQKAVTRVFLHIGRPQFYVTKSRNGIHHLYSILLGKRKSQAPTHTQGEGITQRCGFQGPPVCRVGLQSDRPPSETKHIANSCLEIPVLGKQLNHRCKNQCVNLAHIVRMTQSCLRSQTYSYRK